MGMAGAAQFSSAILTARQSHASQQAAKPKGDRYFGYGSHWKLKLEHYRVSRFLDSELPTAYKHFASYFPRFTGKNPSWSPRYCLHKLTPKKLSTRNGIRSLSLN
jgi:hypothetical protein